MTETLASTSWQALDGIADPALVLDVERARLLDANRDAVWMLAGGGATFCLPLQLDAAMPAIGALRAGSEERRRSGTRTVAELTYWTVKGARRWLSDVRPLVSEASDVVLIRLLPEPSADRQGTLAAALPRRELRYLAHELRTPLAAVLSLADVMHSGHLGPIANERHRDYLASMRDAARHALGVVEAMLGGAPAASAPATDLNAAIGEIAAGMAVVAARSGARIVIQPHAGLPSASVDGTALRQMLLNLVANSLAHAGGGVTVTLSTGLDAGALVWCEVADNGPGIPEAVIDRLARGEPPVETGRPEIGLSLTRELAVASGGRLDLASGPEGARARITLPRYQPSGGVHSAASSSG